MKIRFLMALVLLLSSTAMAQNEKAVFSTPGGIYDRCFYLTITSLSPDHHIRYTTNGATPTSESALFSEPLLLNEQLYSQADIFKIQISPDNLVYVPDSVRHVIVIRAAVFDENETCISPTATNTYLIRELGFDDNNIAVVSICADSLQLFDEQTGIFVPGVHWKPTDPDHTGNYYKHGQDWERPVNVEFYEPNDNSGINQICGLRTHGNRSRRQPAKGMKIYAREEYGKKRFVHTFFPNTPMNSFKHLVLKPFATFWPYSGAQDYTSSTLAIQAGLASSQCRPILLYLNGEYWGMYFIQEKMDERFLEDHYGINIDKCNIIGDWKGTVECGSNSSFKQMLKWFETADLTKKSKYAHACNLIDVESFIDYYVFETFVGNYDWPGNNMRCWQEDNGPWRWLFFDGDATIIPHNFDVFANAAVYEPPTTWANYPEATLLFRKLLENSQFRSAFEAKAREWCNSVFSYENTSTVFNDIIETLRPKINDQNHRFGYPANMNAWDEANGLIDGFLTNRVDEYLAATEAFLDSVELNNPSSFNAFSCFPNPTNGTINIKLYKVWTQPVDLSIIDVTGQIVYQKTLDPTIEKSVTININLSTGIYIVKIDSYTQNLIKF